MNRDEAVTILKELIALNLVHPSFVSLEKNNLGIFSLTVKADCNLTEIRAFLADKDLILYKDEAKGTCTIYKP